MQAAILVAALALAGACVPRLSVSTSPANAAHTGLRVDLYFGHGREGAPPISDEEFATFERISIQPRFPDGYSITGSRGHWRSDDGDEIDERSSVLTVIVPPPVDLAAVDARVERLRREYCERFAQEAVMRVDSTVEVSFAAHAVPDPEVSYRQDTR